jgi:hypothetical protein
MLLQPLAALALVVVAFAPQDKPKEPSAEPKKGDTIVVKGCINGSLIQDDDRLRTFRLTGPKDLLKQIRKEHDNHVDEVTGILQSSLSGTTRGKQFGRTRITIGGGQDPRAPRGAPQEEFLPALEVTSINHLMGTCPAR